MHAWLSNSSVSGPKNVKVFHRIIKNLELVEHILSMPSVFKINFDHVRIIFSPGFIDVDFDLLSKISHWIWGNNEIFLLFYLKFSCFREILIVVLLCVDVHKLNIFAWIFRDVFRCFFCKVLFKLFNMFSSF